MANKVIEHEAAYEAAIRRNIINNAKKTWRSNTPDHQMLEDWLYQFFDGVSYSENFGGSLAKAFNTYGKLTERQADCIRNNMIKAAARKAEWSSKKAAEAATKEWIGVIGKRQTEVLVCNHVVEIQCQPFSYYDSGVSFIHIMEDNKGNSVIYKGGRVILEKGERAEVAFTVKEHGVRESAKQTIIQRPKVGSLYMIVV